MEKNYCFYYIILSLCQLYEVLPAFNFNHDAAFQIFNILCSGTPVGLSNITTNYASNLQLCMGVLLKKYFQLEVLSNSPSSSF